MAGKLRPATPADGAAWVTGASSGIGRAVALKLARQGFTVAVTARSAEALETLAGETGASRGTIVPMPGDVTDAAAMDAIVKRIEAEHGGLALVVLNAGVYTAMDGTAPSVDLFDKHFAVNLEGVTNGLVPAIAAMKPRGRGQIAIVSSVAGYVGLPQAAAYGATKAALINMAEALKFDMDRLGILVQLVCPGFVDTPATAQNPFEMPFLMKVDEAADKLVAGLATTRFEITFPRAFTYQLKLLRALPYWAYFPLVGRATGWRGKGGAGS